MGAKLHRPNAAPIQAPIVQSQWLGVVISGPQHQTQPCVIVAHIGPHLVVDVALRFGFQPSQIAVFDVYNKANAFFFIARAHKNIRSGPKEVSYRAHALKLNRNVVIQQEIRTLKSAGQLALTVLERTAASAAQQRGQLTGHPYLEQRRHAQTALWQSTVAQGRTRGLAP